MADRLLGEPPRTAHPVVGFGWAMQRAEIAIWEDSCVRGAVYAGLGLGVGWLAGRMLAALDGSGPVSTMCATYVVTAGRNLAEEAFAVRALLEQGDLEGVRRRLPALVGRDVHHFDRPESARAVVESVAENTVDAVVAPVLWAALAGPIGAMAYRAINTLDAMVGHLEPRYRRFGWASARLDDLAGWIPARATACLVTLVRPRAAGAVWKAVAHQAPAHPSPNAGVAEAAFAAALGRSLGGENRYGPRIERRPQLGAGPPAETGDIELAVALSYDVGTALSVLLAVPVAFHLVRVMARRAGR
jgi:adenosylcobinamide-phosphate synthase